MAEYKKYMVKPGYTIKTDRGIAHEGGVIDATFWKDRKFGLMVLEMNAEKLEVQKEIMVVDEGKTDSAPVKESTAGELGLDESAPTGTGAKKKKESN